MTGALQVTLNEALGPVRRVLVNGRAYLVAQTTLLVPGVLNGSGGALYYPPEDVAAEPGRWNAVPVVVNHPQAGGAYQSARDPEVLARQGVGHLYRARYEGGLKAEAWLDEEALRRVDNALYEAVARGRPIEVSTGLYTDNVPEAGRYEGKAYAFRAVNYRPDHLALLPASTGACSLADGCGLNVNRGAKMSWLQKISRALFLRGLEVQANQLPSAELDVTPDKACQIVKDQGPGGTDELSEAQLGMFGAKCGERHEEKGGANVNANKAAHVAWLTANCDCFRGKDKLLDQFSENELLELVRNHKIALVVNQGAGEDDEESRPDPGGPSKEGEPEPEMDEETRKRMVALLGEYDQNEVEGARKALAALNRWVKRNAAKAAAPAPSANVQGAAAAEAEYLAQAPPRVRGLLTNAFRVQERERGLLVRRLAANNRAAQERLAKKSYEELVELSELFPPAASAPDGGLPLFLGAAGGPPVDLTANQDDVLDLDAYRKEVPRAT